MAKDDLDPLVTGHRESTGVSQELLLGGSLGAQGRVTVPGPADTPASR